MKKQSGKSGIHTVASGFTLLESVTTLAILAVLLGIAIGPFGRMIEMSRLKSLTNDLLVDVHLARSEAIRLGKRVALCAAKSQTSCSNDGADSGWHQGWMMFVDANNSGTREPEEPLLRFHMPVPEGWRISGNQPVAKYVSYDSLGATRMRSGAFQAGTFTVCKLESLTGKARKLVINSVGRPRVEEADGAMCR